MKERSDLSIIIEQLERLVNQGAQRWCILTFGPEPLEDWKKMKLSDGNVYESAILSWMLPKIELSYLEKALPVIKKAYPEFKSRYDDIHNK